MKEADPLAAEEERRYLEVSRYQLLRQSSRKRPRDEGAAGGGYTEVGRALVVVWRRRILAVSLTCLALALPGLVVQGIRACGRALAVSLVVSERRRHRGAEAPPPWVVVVLGDVGGSGPVHVYLEGQAAVQWHPFLRVGGYYDFPLLHEASQSFPVPAGVLVCRAGRQGQPPVPPMQRCEEEARPLLGVFENGSNRPWTGRAPGPAPGPAPPPSSLVMSYEGKIRGQYLPAYSPRQQALQMSSTRYAPHACPSALFLACLACQACTATHCTSWSLCPAAAASTCSSPTTCPTWVPACVPAPPYGSTTPTHSASGASSRYWPRP